LFRVQFEKKVIWFYLTKYKIEASMFSNGSTVLVIDGDKPEYTARILHSDVEPKNRGSPNVRDTETYYYAELLDHPYQDILLQGWVIYCYLSNGGTSEKCVITSIDKKIDTFTVEKYDPFQYHPLQMQYTIGYNNIESILLCQKHFILKQKTA